MSAPFSRTLEASARLADGLTVLMSTRTLPSLNPARNPSGPSATDLSASVFVTIAKVTSAAAETALGESPHFMPRSTSHCALERVRLYPVTACPLSSSLFTIWLPITPSPMNPRFAIRLRLLIKKTIFSLLRPDHCSENCANHRAPAADEPALLHARPANHAAL